ncbi:2-oxo-4-hydroxy-4-carboxy-5-ureidoimidazoline decarboxylase [Phyllobacterium sp. 0TCS1.6C]|uniref:2-oxo-4-hydroxy-4-carboxy-5-ureidoimidazoline decarboxylase n=1 Tax=unclassified Phyllobacterium TaxID=2638441 RepID=UPI002263CF93|nr:MULTISPECIES: 2-oxo-4-hydroxy-4-carboxy-5-ureidoimidazoline decarboxylase [unclassified Phyllobacterium]MCX8281350.1 2-oxo-4-hydroxy-4-carboxy-5-ureidoimidazoline decarboxylase [Phyllobacterium sp. 0TCS1.6C]MCX8295994.1 2-oxo-4-hydroxy-4-carboxy-5-ureidoimidazoline decarboxylase [Phyllobacterium sp. 0TCS1.6A]
MKLESLNSAESDAFVAALAGIYEHSPWVAEAVADARPFASVDALHEAMNGAVARAGRKAQLDLIRAHPDLAGKAALAGALTAESTGEQRGAGLDRLTEAEFAEFHRLNDEYRGRFGFPFILAVRGHDKHSILASFRQRLANDIEAETEEALSQIGRIAGFRLRDLLEEQQ